MNGVQARTLIMLDESGKSVMPVVAAAWAARGQTPRLTRLFRRIRLAVIGAVIPTGKLHYRLHRQRICSAQVIECLEHLMRQIRGRIDLFWDGGSIHTPKVAGRFLEEYRDRVRTNFFPAHAPEVSPRELGWQHLKYVELRNLCPRNAEELLEETRAGRERIRHHPALIPPLFEHAGLTLVPG